MAFDIKMPVLIPDAATVIKGKLGKPFVIPENAFNNDGIYYPKVSVNGEDTQDAMISWMGTPVIFPITFTGQLLDKPYKVYKPSGELEEVKMEEFVLPAATVVEFSRAKNIIQTDVLGGSGTVKELFGFDDWQIRMRGICLKDNARQREQTPQQQKETLMAWERIAGSIKVIGSLFDEKKITNIVIQSISIRQLEGKPWAIPFEINAMSDEAMQLVI